jgi:hypothetical protein
MEKKMIAEAKPVPQARTPVPILAMIGALISVGIYFPQSSVYAVSLCIIPMLMLAGFLSNIDGFYMAIPTIGALAVLGGYTILTYFNRDSIDSMPGNWNAYNTIIGALVSAHFVFLMIGKGFKQLTWVTVTGLLLFVLMQYVISIHFRTNG